eukprot:730053-Amphidinium_carterae.1
MNTCDSHPCASSVPFHYDPKTPPNYQNSKSRSDAQHARLEFFVSRQSLPPYGAPRKKANGSGGTTSETTQDIAECSLAVRFMCTLVGRVASKAYSGAVRCVHAL